VAGSCDPHFNFGTPAIYGKNEDSHKYIDGHKYTVQVQVGGLWQGHVIHILTLGPLLSMERMKIVINSHLVV